jgi:putative flavoprotein involved in K+ transport
MRQVDGSLAFDTFVTRCWFTGHDAETSIGWAERVTANKGSVNGLHRSVLVIGGGQAGLAMSYCLVYRGIDHLVLEGERVGNSWTGRWDSLRLVTPNWQCQLPGFGYQGGDPDEFMHRDQVVAYLRAYSATFGAPLVEGITATTLRRGADGGFEVVTRQGTLTADQVVVATGPGQVPLCPESAGRIPAGITQLHSSAYTAPGDLPEGAVLVVGSGQSGGQIAEELSSAGRQVHLAVGGSPRVARTYRGRDVVAWLDDMGCYRRDLSEWDAAAHLGADHYVSGIDGGHDIDLRRFALEGTRLYGHLTGVRDGRVFFAPDLERSLDASDAAADAVSQLIDTYIATVGVEAPPGRRYQPVWRPDREVTELELASAGITCVVWATGVGRDDSWIDVPVFGPGGWPVHRGGVTGCPGLYFLGLPGQRTWGSARLCGVGADARYLVEQIVARRTGGTFGVRRLPPLPLPGVVEEVPRTVA